MARGKKPSVRHWASRGGFCCWIDGTQHLLAKGPDDAPRGPTYLAALERFKKLLALEADKGTDDYLVSALLNQYRVHLKESRRNDVPGIFDSMARGFSAEFGGKRARDLVPHDFEAWLKRQSQWGPTSKAHAGRLILGAVSWAVKKGLVGTNPLAGRVTLPEPVLRGREARMPTALMDLLVDEAYEGNRLKTPQFADVLRALRHTGARPVEVRRAEAHNYEWKGGKGRIVFRWNARRGYVHKTAKSTQRDRVIYLPPQLQGRVEELVKKFPSGPLFRAPRGEPWTRNGLCNKWTWLLCRPRVIKYCREHEIELDTLKMYNFRHSWASDYLDATGDIFGCAQMLGTSVKMVEKRYGHPDVEQVHGKYLAFMAERE